MRLQGRHDVQIQKLEATQEGRALRCTELTGNYNTDAGD